MKSFKCYFVVCLIDLNDSAVETKLADISLGIEFNWKLKNIVWNIRYTVRRTACRRRGMFFSRHMRAAVYLVTVKTQIFKRRRFSSTWFIPPYFIGRQLTNLPRSKNFLVSLIVQQHPFYCMSSFLLPTFCFTKFPN